MDIKRAGSQPSSKGPADWFTGTVSVYVAGKRTGDEVVFGEPGDLTLLGSRTLEGLNFRVEPVTKQLVDAGPAPAAALADAFILSSLLDTTRALSS